MNSITKLKDALHLRMYGNPDEYFEETVWNLEVDAICEDLTAAIDFVLSECTDEELYWLSEVFEDIADRTRSADFIKCLQKRVQRVENAEWRQSILDEILVMLDYVDEPLPE
ncbi:MAG: hypothetical protein E7331_08185 [Clostridiales bacterium]|nr:hypothetical protein [Clostridiales bacterium]